MMMGIFIIIPRTQAAPEWEIYLVASIVSRAKLWQ